MDIRSPGEGVLALRSGTVTAVSGSEIVVGDKQYTLKPKDEANLTDEPEGTLVFPTSSSWHEPAVEVGDEVTKRELLARGVTRIYFQANVWIFTGLVFLAGIVLGIGKAAVYKHIPEYFPTDVGVVGGVVGVLGGLGGFVSPIIFGYLLKATGIWTTNWMFLALVSLICLAWMHMVIQRMMREKQPHLARDIEYQARPAGETASGGQS
jgi:NNP family nitrate/nitrite transporter-like MFS transporter